MDRYRVEGMTCAACSAHVDKAVRKLPFVDDVQVDLLGGSMRVKTSDGSPHEAEIVSAVDRAGYHAISTSQIIKLHLCKKKSNPCGFDFGPR